jgi:GNAT superfamily N-acetyltransferase
MSQASDSVVIRSPQTGDGSGLARTWLDAAGYYTQLDAARFRVPEADGLAEWFEESSVQTPVPDHALLRVAAYDELVIGFILAFIRSPVADAARQFVRDVSVTRLEIAALLVQQRYWRQGVGGRLLREAEVWGRAQGAVVVVLDTYHASPVSVPFYEQHMGYERTALAFRKELQS